MQFRSKVSQYVGAQAFQQPLDSFTGTLPNVLARLWGVLDAGSKSPGSVGQRDFGDTT